MVSVIVSFYERLSHLQYCLDSLRFSRHDFDEVIISDDGSSVETVNALHEMIAACDYPVRHVWQEKNGFRVAAARNNGIRNARGDYLLFFDCDFLILPGAVKAHIERAERGRFIAGNCKYLSDVHTADIFRNPLTPDRLEYLYRSLPDQNLNRGHRKFLIRTFFMKMHLMSPTKQSLGGHFSIHRADMEKINGYDENFTGWGGEDEDVGIRLVMAGIYGRSVIPQARVLHMWHPRALGNASWKNGPNIEYFNRKKEFFCRNGLH